MYTLSLPLLRKSVILAVLSPLPLLALDSVPGLPVSNPEWEILITPEGYADVALDRRPGFEGREYLSGEWAAAIGYTKGGTMVSPTWFRRTWGFPCWDSNSNFSVIQRDNQSYWLADPPRNDNEDPDYALRWQSAIENGDVEITMTYEMIDTGTGIDQGDAPASAGDPGARTTSSRYVFRQTYLVKNVSGGQLSGIRFYQFLHGLESGISLYDNRNYDGEMGTYHFDNTQKGSKPGFDGTTNEIYTHEDTITMHSMVAPSAFECGNYGIPPDDNHQDTGKPSDGVHLKVENDTLNGTDMHTPPAGGWVSGAMRFNFPSLEFGETHEMSVLLSLRTESTFLHRAPQIEILDAGIVGSEYVIDFMETTEAPINGYILRTTKDLGAEFPNEWPQIGVPRFIDVPFNGANRFKAPIDLQKNPFCFFTIQPVL